MKKSMSTKKKILLYFISACFWLFLWQFFSYKINNNIFLPSFKDTIFTFFQLFKTKEFYTIIGTTFIKISKGFIMAIIVGTLLANISYVFIFVRILLEPIIKLIKAVPVASFIILSLLWINSNNLSTLISFLMVLPVIYINVLQGIDNTDNNLLEMVFIFNMSYGNKLKYLFFPAAFPNFIAACKIGLGLCFKAGIAAEIIGLPNNSIGEALYNAKLYLMTKEMFAWTLVIVLLSFIFEFVFIKLLDLLMYFVLHISPSCQSFFLRRHPSRKSKKIQSLKSYSQSEDKFRKISPINSIEINNINKIYGTNHVLKNFSYNFSKNDSNIFFITGVSGCGKTTLMRILSGLEKADSGTIFYNYTNTFASKTPIYNPSMVFQEDRLINEFSALDNIKALYGKKYSTKYLMEQFSLVGLTEYMNKPVISLSGGMKRRIAIVRAMLSDSPLILMDEPFKGLDEELANKVINYVKENLNNRMLIIITHHNEEIKKLEGVNLHLA